MSATLEELRLTLNPGEADERQYDIYPIQEVSIASRKNAFSISPPGLAAAENILLGVSGMEADITIQAWAWNDGSDRANGTHTSTVTTLTEQTQYVEDTMHAPDFGATWQLDHTTGAAFNDDEVFVETVEPTILSTQDRKWLPIRFSLRRGGSL